MVHPVSAVYLTPNGRMIVAYPLSDFSPAVCMQIQYYIASALQVSVNNQVIRFLIGFDIFEFEPCGKTSVGNIFTSWDLGDLRCGCGGSDKFLVIRT